MIASITQAAPSEQPAASSAAAPQASSKAAPQSSSTDTVQISNAAKALLQENQETPVQTAREARSGDTQAIKLLAREAAAKASGAKSSRK